MALTRDFKETVKARAERDAAFRSALLQEAMQALVDGEVDLGKAVLRDYVNATIGFEALSKATKTPPKSLMRMLSASGNPTADRLFSILAAVQKKTGTKARVQVS